MKVGNLSEPGTVRLISVEFPEAELTCPFPATVPVAIPFRFSFLQAILALIRHASVLFTLRFATELFLK